MPRTPFRRAACGALLASLAAFGLLAFASAEARAGSACNPGEWFDGNACLQCSCGHYCPDGFDEFACPVGTENPFTGSSSSSDCLPCTPGSAAGAPGTCSCNSCTAGTFASSSGSAFCSPCAPGTAEPDAGSSQCSDCAPGTYQPNAGAAQCLDCPPDEYQPDPGANACFACACDDQNSCTLDSCDEIDGTCSSEPNPVCENSVPSLPPGGLWFFGAGLLLTTLVALRLQWNESR